MENPRLEVELELWLVAGTTATAMGDPRCTCELYRSSWQRQILNPLSEATQILMGTSRVHYRWATMGTPPLGFNASTKNHFWWISNDCDGLQKAHTVC